MSRRGPVCFFKRAGSVCDVTIGTDTKKLETVRDIGVAFVLYHFFDFRNQAIIHWSNIFTAPTDYMVMVVRFILEFVSKRLIA